MPIYRDVQVMGLMKTPEGASPDRGGRYRLGNR